MLSSASDFLLSNTKLLGYIFCCCSVTQSCPTLCHSIHCSIPAFLYFTISQTFFKLTSVELVMPSNHLVLCHPPAFSLSQHQVLSQWVDFLHQVAKASSVLPVNTQDWFPVGFTGLISLQSKWLSKVFSNTTTQKYKFFGTFPSLWSSSHLHTGLLEKP